MLDATVIIYVIIIIDRICPGILHDNILKLRVTRAAHGLGKLYRILLGLLDQSIDYEIVKTLVKILFFHNQGES